MFPRPKILITDNQEPITRAGGASPNNRQPITINRVKLAKGGFTLVELTVVMLIITALAALLLTGASSLFERARRTQAKNDLIQLVSAINAFYTEYGRYPVNVPTTNTIDAFYGTGTVPSGCNNYGNNDVLLDVLRNNTTGGNAATVTSMNPRGIPFINPRSVQATKGGVNYSDNRFYDPWGKQYNFAIDTNYDNTISNPYADIDGSAGSSPLRIGVIGYSYGRNGARGGGAASGPGFSSESGTAGKFKSSSDIISWQ